MKYKLLIVDDEPLVQVGIKSMLDWSSYDIEICGTAANGSIALDMIESCSPDIVITDIKMPVMDGMSLIENYRKRTDSMLPVFIMLTSYEEFSLAKKAISLNVFEYLVKVELTPESLGSTIQNAIKHIESFAHSAPAFEESKDTAPAPTSALHRYTEKFMISLLNNMFESREQLIMQAEDLNISFAYKSYICCYGSFSSKMGESASKGLLSLYDSALQMVRELSEKFCHCYTISLDISHICLIFCSENEGKDDDISKLSDVLSRIVVSLNNYMGVDLRMGIGSVVSDPVSICDSYQHSRLSFRQTDIDCPIKYVSPESISPHDAFHFSLFQKDLTKAYEEYNSELLRQTIKSLCEILYAHPEHYVQALDAASNILYMSLSLLPDSEKMISGFYSDSPESYMSLYHQTSTVTIISWLEHLIDMICKFFDESKKDYKNRIVSDVKNYITEHVREKLTLNEVAAQFGISPSYLSQLFSRYNEAGFSEYINICKINAAKVMLREENSKVYEVADALSFGSEFYFSKVFKKVEGISPTEYINGSYT